MIKRLSGWRNEFENFCIGWIYNPVIDLWNGFADFHNARFEARQNANQTEAESDDEGMSATLDGKTYKIRELWFEDDFKKVLNKAIKSASKVVRNREGEKRPSKRQKNLQATLGHKINKNACTGEIKASLSILRAGRRG